jgi:hypothetical protein
MAGIKNLEQLMIRTGLKISFFVVTLLFSIHSIVFASAKGNAFYEFIEDPINSRSIGMGTAGTAVPDNRGFTFYNPALPSLNKRPYLSFDYNRQYEDLGRGQAEFSWISEKWFCDIAFLSQSKGDFQITDEQGIKDGATGTNQSSMGTLGGGFRKSSYSFGITLSGVQDKIANYTSYGLMGSAGAVFNIIPDKLYGGLAVLNFGRNSSFLDTTHSLDRDYLPLTFRGGLSWSDKLKAKYPYTVAVDMVYSKNYQKLMVPVGVEFWLLPALALRIGKRINFDSDLFSFGTGLRLENIGFDAAFTPTRVVTDVGVKWSMGITYYLASPKKKVGKTVNKILIDTTKNITADSAQATAPVTKIDSIPAFKAPVERKINRNKAVDTNHILIDSSKVLEGTTLDTLPTPAPAVIDSVMSQSKDRVLPVVPAAAGQENQSSSSVDSLVTSDSDIPVNLPVPDPKLNKGTQVDSSAIIENNKPK